jgi:hypothetical protein
MLLNMMLFHMRNAAEHDTTSYAHCAMPLNMMLLHMHKTAARHNTAHYAQYC